MVTVVDETEHAVDDVENVTVRLLDVVALTVKEASPNVLFAG